MEMRLTVLDRTGYVKNQCKVKYQASRRNDVIHIYLPQF